MIEISTKEECTGCGACASVCPKECISLKEDEIGVVLPIIDTNLCIECNACRKVCPALNRVEKYHIKQSYAAWSNDEKHRKMSASGGIAVEMYRYAKSNGWEVCGAIQNSDFTVSMKMAEDDKDIEDFQNSKYVFCDMQNIYQPIKDALKNGRKVLFVGLPCQCAALKRLYPNSENILLVDLVCHGSTPFSYLRQHIDTISKKCGQKPIRMYFRDPNQYTYTYTFTLYNAENECFYAKRTKEGDAYNIGYHGSISYRENCYHCAYACPERVGDITLSDYSGLGTVSPCDYDHKKVSAVMVNSSKGEIFFKALTVENLIHADERPVNENIDTQGQMRRPSPKTKDRREFEKKIIKNGGDYIRTINPIMKKRLRRMRTKALFLNVRIKLGKIKRIIIGEKIN